MSFPATSQFRPLTEDRFELGESPVWDGDANALYWVDITAGRLHRLDIASGQRDA